MSNPNYQGDLNWKASGGGMNGITFNPPNGTLPQGQMASETIALPDTVCPASATFTFSDQASAVAVPWTCVAPVMTGSSGHPGNVCPADAKGNFVCTVFLALASGSEGGLNWSASGSAAGVTYSQSNGTLIPNQPQTVMITIPASDCPGAASIFSAIGSTVTVTFTCMTTNTSTPTPTPSTALSPTPTSSTTLILTGTSRPKNSPTPTVMPADTPKSIYIQRSHYS